MGLQFNECGCIQLIHSWYADLGIKLPDSFEGLTLSNYFEFWERDKKAAIAKMLYYFNSLGEESTILGCHDLIAVKEKGNTYAAVYLGNGMAITSNINSGVRVFHLGRYHKVILIRRIL